MIGPKRLDAVVEEASKVFWEAVAKQFPEISVNNLDNGTVIVLHWQMREVIERWIRTNLEAMEETDVK